jgi:hypothetical protein
MTTDVSTHSAQKLPYSRPEISRKGSVAEITQQVKDFGLADGFVLLDDSNPLKNLS